MGRLQEGNCRDKGPGSGGRGRVFNDRTRNIVFWEWWKEENLVWASERSAFWELVELEKESD